MNRLTVNLALPLVQVLSWKSKLPLQTIMRLLQVLVPQVEKICIDKYEDHGYLYIYSVFFFFFTFNVFVYFFSQRFDRRVRDPEIPPTRHPGGAFACASPYSDQKIPGECRHCHVVPHIHVGRHLSPVSTVYHALKKMAQNKSNL